MYSTGQRRALVFAAIALSGLHLLQHMAFPSNTRPQESFFCDLEQAPPKHLLAKQSQTCPITFVTQYFRLPSKHAHDEYVGWIRNQQSKMCLLIFTDSPSLWLELPTQAVVRTGICEEGRALNHSQCFWREQWHQDVEASIHRSYQLYLTWNLKAHFLREAVRLNVFSSRFFFWVDAGYMRDPSLFPGSAVGLSPHLPTLDRMVFLMVHPFGEEELGGNYRYTTGQDRIAGNMFGGGAKAVESWSSLYYQVVDEYVDRGWFVGKDQNMMNTLCIKHRGACTLVEPRGLAIGENPWYALWGCLHATRDCLFY